MKSIFFILEFLSLWFIKNWLQNTPLVSSFTVVAIRPHGNGYQSEFWIGKDSRCRLVFFRHGWDLSRRFLWMTGWGLPEWVYTNRGLNPAIYMLDCIYIFSFEFLLKPSKTSPYLSACAINSHFFIFEKCTAKKIHKYKKIQIFNTSLDFRFWCGWSDI